MAEAGAGGAGAAAPTYPQALREFVSSGRGAQSAALVERLAAEQAALEQKWHARHAALARDGASEAALADFDRRVHHQASRFAADMNARLGRELGIRVLSSDAAPRHDRAKFMRLLSDFVAK